MQEGKEGKKRILTFEKEKTHRESHPAAEETRGVTVKKKMYFPFEIQKEGQEGESGRGVEFTKKTRGKPKRGKEDPYALKKKR